MLVTVVIHKHININYLKILIMFADFPGTPAIHQNTSPTASVMMKANSYPRQVVSRDGGHVSLWGFSEGNLSFVRTPKRNKERRPMQSHSIRPHEESPIPAERCGSPSHLISNRRATRWSARRELSVRLTGPNEHAAEREPPA